MRIVLGTDGSERSETACRLVQTTDWPADTVIRIVSVAGGREEVGRRAEAAHLAARAFLATGYPTETVVALGRPADVLLAEADEVRADLIVVGSRGLGAAASAVLGSVSAALVDQASCPVLVVRRPSVSRVLVATDGSRSAEAIPSVLKAWGAFKAASIEVLAVRPPPGDGVGELAPGIPWVLGGERQVLHAEHDVDRYQVVTDDMAAQLARAGWSARGSVRRGDAARGIEEAAQESEVDLIVTGSRGLSGLQRRLLGSVAHHVLLHSRCSVLVMRGHVPGRDPLRDARPTAIAPS